MAKNRDQEDGVIQTVHENAPRQRNQQQHDPKRERPPSRKT